MAQRTATANPAWNDWVLQLDRIFKPKKRQFIEPLSEEWRQARRGRLTASTRAAIIHDREPAAWNQLMDEMDREMAADYKWAEMDAPPLKWGRDHEKQAIANIMFDEAEDLVEPGLIFHKDYPFVAATPDAVVGKKTTIQIKCPYNPKNHLATLYTKSIKPVYFAQVQWEMWVAEAEAARFYSFDPRQPLKTRLVRIDIPRNEEMLDIFRRNVEDFATMFNANKRLAEGKVSVMGIPELF